MAGDAGDRGVGRLDTIGSRDRRFAIVPAGPVNVVITPAVDFTPDVYIGGVAMAGVSLGNVTRVDQSGAPDNDFVTGSGITGSLVPDLTDPVIRSIEPAPFSAGAIYVGGSFTAYDGNPANGIVRINNDGTQDFNFMTGSGFNGPPEVIEGATDGSTNIYVGGGFGFPSPGYNGTPGRGIVRLREDGSLDNSFAPRITFNNNVCTN